MFGDKIHMAQEHRLERRQWIRLRPCQPVNSRQKTLGDPFHDTLPDRVLGGKVPEQRPVRQLHPRRDCRGGDVFGVGAGGEIYRRLYGLDGSPIVLPLSLDRAARR